MGGCRLGGRTYAVYGSGGKNYRSAQSNASKTDFLKECGHKRGENDLETITEALPYERVCSRKFSSCGKSPRRWTSLLSKQNRKDLMLASFTNHLSTRSRDSFQNLAEPLRKSVSSST